MSLPAAEVRDRDSSGTPPEGTATVALEEVNVVVSDMHISEGLERNEKYRPSRLRRSWNWLVGLFSSVERHPVVNPKNPLEDFPDDGKFVSFLDKVLETYGCDPIIRLRLNGDTFDPLAVTWDGRFADPPYEHVAAGKIGRIIAGHPRFFDALASFIRQPNCHVDFFVGNHDLFMVWERVQRKILRRLVGEDAELAKKVRFVDQHMAFRDVHREVLYIHGHDAEANNTIDPQSVVLTHRFGRKIQHPILNVPYGSFMTVGLVNKIKLHNPLVGRLTNYKALWRNAAIHKWGWAFYALLATVGNYLSNAFFDIWDVRRKTRLRLHLQIILQTMEDQPVDTYAKKLLKEYAGKVKAVILGHSHEHRRVTGPEGTYINTGTWVLLFDLRWRKFEEHEFRWKRCRQLETVWLTTKHLFKTGELRFATYITRVLGWIAFVSALVVFLLFSFPKEGWSLWSYQIADFKVPAFILLVFLLVSGLARFLSSNPEVVVTQRLTFGLVRHYSDGGLNVELMEYLPEDQTFRECV
jgi:UDP-2,3-diacylglucosamine pyrophosphatase LpxH